jgi:hypothetical protein
MARPLLIPSRIYRNKHLSEGEPAMNEECQSVEEMFEALYAAQQRLFRDECERLFQPLEALLRGFEDATTEAA